MAKELKDTDGFVLHGWMANQLNLSLGELVAFALVHQFSQSSAGVYLGGPGYLMKWLGCSENTARKYLHNLWDKGLILNDDQEVNGVTFRNYRVNYDHLREITHPLKNLPTTPQNLRVEYNIENNTPNGDNISIPPTPKKFDFREALLGLGVEPKVADDWLLVRKNKKATNSETAFKAIVKEIAKSGKSANECIRIAVVKDWRGFQADWLEEDKGTKKSAASPKPDKFERMMAVGSELFYQPQNPVYDEQ